MEQPTSSSKVTVEYFDPYNVYQLLSPGLLRRLPLQNLHWESHAGPLRSIQSIHIDLVPSAKTRPLSSSSASDLSRVRSSDSAASGDDGFRTQALGKSGADKERPDSGLGHTKGPVKERRHQIPGLRQTPYLKVFFLRCDDNDTYKSQARKQVREWIKEHTVPSQGATKSSAQENHDAFEWLIVHIVVPNTAASTQPRISTKGSSTLLEKLRADFNGTSKSTVDRVAQIRIGVNDVPYDILPRVIPAIPGSYTETVQENKEAWEDLIQKFKTLILASFDMRVTQYEDDIREKDAQRTLPGWNFCTFFVLKEGLARGFESVGLVEDALVGYDELAVGLDAIVREQAVAGSAAEHGGEFLPYTEDLRKGFDRSLAALRDDEGVVADDTDGPIDLQTAEDGPDNEEIPLSASLKNYRELILSNNISVFDFRCYLFARQLSLLLRMGNAWSSREELLAKLKEQRESSLQGVAARPTPIQPKEDAENLAMLAEVCRRALEFITSISRVMRQDFLASEAERRKHGSTNNDVEDIETAIGPLEIEIIENLVSSFTFSVAQQILAQTSTKSLPIPPSTIAPPSDSKMYMQSQEPKAAIPEPKTMMHPARQSSLRIDPRQPPSPGIFPGARTSADQVETPKPSSTFLKAGLEELAAHRAELYVLSRIVLERLGAARGWSVGWDLVSHLRGHVGELENVDLNDNGAASEKEKSPLEEVTPTLHGILNRLLRTALDNKDDFYRLHETLTDKAMRHYTVANHVQSVQSKMVDLALLKFQLGDFGAAASYFYRMTPFYGEGGWEGIEMYLLVLYTKCLKELKQSEEYVRVALKLLAKGAAVEKERLRRKSAPIMGTGAILGSGETVSVDGYLEELMTVLPLLQRDTTVPLQTFFANVDIEGNICYSNDRDSFTLQFRFLYLLSDELIIERAKARLVPLSGGQGRDIWLEMDDLVPIKKGITRLRFNSNVIIPGTYVVKQIVLHANKLILSYDSETATQTPSNTQKFLKCPRLLLYQRPDAFDVKLFASRYLHLNRNRSLEIELSTGWNDVTNGELHVRAATAGLRLQTSEAKVMNGQPGLLKKSEAGVIRFGVLQPASRVKIFLPFNLENDTKDISIKIEISYTTDKGVFFFATNPSVSIMLPLGVNVQDVFKHNALFSKFTISSATSSPLRLLSSKLENSDTFEANHGADLRDPVMIFPRQPASLLYKITPCSSSITSLSAAGATKREKSSLSLVIHYICLEEEIDNAVNSALLAALQGTPFWQYARLIIPIVISQLHAHISSYNLEKTAIMGELSTSVLSSINWRDYFLALNHSDNQEKDKASSIAEWIEKWSDRTSSITLLPIDTSEDTIANSRSIIIPVDVPSVTVVHTADIKLLYKGSTSGEVVAMTHEPIPATLEIKWTRIWDTNTLLDQRSSKPGVECESVEDLDFVYEVLAATDMWLIGGKRKGHFKVPRAKEEAQKGVLKFPIVMIPIKAGHLPYPHLEIRPALAPKPENRTGTASEDGGPLNTAVTCETDYKNIGESIRVISNARKTTVSLDAAGPQGGAWLLESEKRECEMGAFVV